MKFVGRLVLNGRSTERIEFARKIHGAVSHCKVGRNLSAVGCILHDHIDSTPNAVAFKVGSKRFTHFKAVEHFGRENIKGNKTVFIIGRGNFYTIDQRIVVALVHTAQNGILSFTAGTALKGYTRDTA